MTRLCSTVVRGESESESEDIDAIMIEQRRRIVDIDWLTVLFGCETLMSDRVLPCPH